MLKLPNNETTLSLGRAVSRLLALKRYMRKPNQGQLSAVKMGHLQTTITKLSWGQVHHPSFRRHFAVISPPSYRICSPFIQILTILM